VLQSFYTACAVRSAWQNVCTVRANEREVRSYTESEAKAMMRCALFTSQEPKSRFLLRPWPAAWKDLKGINEYIVPTAIEEETIADNIATGVTKSECSGYQSTKISSSLVI
jgi:hypothetical protein